MKAEEILVCQEFSHTSCGIDIWTYVTAIGYLPSACMLGENLGVVAPAEFSTARGIADMWSTNRLIR